MNVSKYALIGDETFTVYEFVSTGSKGKIKKLIKYTPTIVVGVYNLGFGDIKEGSNIIDDEAITNNGDRDKVLATVVGSLYAFYEKFPDAMVYIRGSNAARTRLYQMAINAFYWDLYQDFEIFGMDKKDWGVFNTATNYSAFLVQRKYDYI